MLNDCREVVRNTVAFVLNFCPEGHTYHAHTTATLEFKPLFMYKGSE